MSGQWRVLEVASSVRPAVELADDQVTETKKVWK